VNRVSSADKVASSLLPWGARDFRRQRRCHRGILSCGCRGKGLAAKRAAFAEILFAERAHGCAVWSDRQRWIELLSEKFRCV